MQKYAKKYVEDLANKFRDQVYNFVIPWLANGIKSQLNKTSPTPAELQGIYQMTMKVLFKLLFVAYAEEKILLPHRSNVYYRENSLKNIAENLLELWNSGHVFGTGFKWWKKVKAIFHAFEYGNPDWDIPAYSGGLFSIDQGNSIVLAPLEKINLPDEHFGRILQYLLLVRGADGEQGLVDFRSLGLGEFGTIYEGLLESELSIAETNLVQEKKGKNKDTFRECLEHEGIDILKGQVYLSNSSGARKSSGSYYTKNFAVEHLLDGSLEKAIDEHLKLLDSLNEQEAGENFFDFKVADIAMGSGNFLLAAVDRMEFRFSVYLSKRNLPLVSKELDHLRKSAKKSLAESADSYPEIEDSSLLRRQIARRCIYGADNNEVAVQLSRVGLWIHTFIPGLPLSLLERNLVHGDSLMGIGNLSEFEEKLKEDEGENFFSINVQDYISGSRKALLKTIQSPDATQKELKEARLAWVDTEGSVASTNALCDILVAARIENKKMPLNFMYGKTEKESILDSPEYMNALSVFGSLKPIHFPVIFPEVFLRKKNGFDVILGNPPWKKPRVEEHEFWARYSIGLRGLNQRKREVIIKYFRKTRPELLTKLEDEVSRAKILRKVLTTGPFPGMGTGDPDLYKAFCWRFWSLVAQEGGRIGVVLPRSVFSVKGSEEFRKKLLSEANHTDLVTLNNAAHWVFNIESRYTFALVSIERRINPESRIELSGPYNSLSSFETRKKDVVASFPGKDVLSWNDSASLPLLTYPTDISIEVLKQIRLSPRLDMDKDARPHRELDAFNDKHLFDLESEVCPEGFWPVYKGASFDLWEPESGVTYAWADDKIVTKYLQEKRIRGNNLSTSVFNECDADWCRNPDTLPCRFPRIAFRDVSRATDNRTVRCALIPPNVFLVHTAPYFVFPNQSIGDTTYLLGILSSISLDWYARRFVETHLTYSTINPFPIPRPEKNNPLRKRVIELAGRLACPDERFAEWAKEVGVEFGSIEEDEKQDMIDELDAVVAHLYGLSKEQLMHIFETFHVGWDYHVRLEATLKHYQNI